MATFMAVILKGKIHIKQDKTTNIKIRIIHNKQVGYFSTDLYVLPGNFIKGQAKGKNSLFINGRIRDELDKYQERYLKLGNKVHNMDISELKERLCSEDLTFDIDFLKFSDNYIDKLKKQGRSGTARGLNGVVSNLKKFSDTVKFNDIDLRFLNEFVEFLKDKGVKNGIDNYMRGFRMLFNKGLEEFNDEDRGIIRIPHYPFRKFKFEKVKRKTAENRLTVDQMKIFINYKPVREREQMAKDMFLLMFYLIGINTADLYLLEKPDMKGRINYVRAKTGRDYSIKLEPEAIEIIGRYQDLPKLINASNSYGNYMDWQKYINIELKKIGKSIEKELKKEDSNATFPNTISTNWARHSWATIARNDCRINKDDVALCLGHEDSDNKVTDIYINYDYSIIDESNRKVLDTLIEKVETTPVAKTGRKKKDTK